MAGGKNKPKGPSSSARAAAFLNKNAASNFSPGLAASGAAGFGFGSALTPEHSQGQLDPETAQCLKHVTKRDEVTKIKALNTLIAKFKELEAEDAAEVLPSWLFAFKRVSMDNARAVRLGGIRVLSQIVQQAGRKLAPHLKALMGCWWLSMHDTYPEARHVALASFQACFTTPQKRRQVLVHVRASLVAHLRDSLFASPDDLGEPAKESKEQLEDRHQRVCTQVLLALTGIAELFPAPNTACTPASTASGAASAASPVAGEAGLATPAGSGGTPPATSADASPASAEEHETMLEALVGLWRDPAFWERVLKGSAPPVFNAACHLVSKLVQHQLPTVQQIESTLAPLVFASLKSAPEQCQGPAWAMCLRLAAACPSALCTPAATAALPKQIGAILRSGRVSSAAAGGLVPLTVQMLRHGPAGWSGGDLSALWLPAALNGFQNAPAAALGGAAEVLAGLLLVMVSSAPDTGAALAAEVVSEATASRNAAAWAHALWTVISSYVTSAESRLRSAAVTILTAYTDVTITRLSDDDTAVAEAMANQVSVLADLASAAAAPAQAAQLMQSALLAPLMQHLQKEALAAALSRVQASTLHKLLRSLSIESGVCAEAGRELLRAAVSRMLATGTLQPPGGEPQPPAEAADLLLVQALLQSGTVSLPMVLDAAMHHALPASGGAGLQPLLTGGHTLHTFTAACKPLIAQVSPSAVQDLSSFVQLVLADGTDSECKAGDGHDAECGEGILLLLLGHALLPKGSTAGAALLRSPAAAALQRRADPGKDAGLLYMLAVLFRDAASAAASSVDEVGEASAQALLRAPALVPAAAHCCRACIDAPTALRPATSIAHCEAIMCSLFELAVPHVLGASRAGGLAPGARALQTVAAATWQQLVQPLTAAAGTLSPGLPAELMRRLVQWHARCSTPAPADEQSAWTVVLPAQASEDVPGGAHDAADGAGEGEGELLQLCHLAGAAADTALGILDVACAHGDPAAAETAVSALLQAPGGSAVPPASTGACRGTPDELQGSLPRPRLLLAACVMLRSRGLESLRQYVPWLALAAGIAHEQWPAVFRHALMAHVLAAADPRVGAANEVCRQLLRHATAGSDSAPTALAALAALLRHAPPEVSRAAVRAFTECASELPQHVLGARGAQRGSAAQAVSAVAPHVCAQAARGDAAAAAARDEVAAVVLQQLSRHAPLLAEQAEGSAAGEAQPAAAAMQCVAELYIPEMEAPAPPPEDAHSAELLSLLTAADAPLRSPAHAAGGHSTADAQPTEAGASDSGPAQGGGDSQEDGRESAPHAALVYSGASAEVLQAFSAAVAHQLRPARAVGMMASAPPAAAGGVLRLLLAASTVAQQGQAAGADRLYGLVEARLAAATVAAEARTEDVCEALVAASQQLAGAAAADGDEASAQQRIATVMELGWSDPRKARALLAPVQTAAEAPISSDTTALVGVQLFMQLRELQKAAPASEAGAGTPAVVQRIERLLLRLLLCAGTCMHVARLVQAPAETAAGWLPGSEAFWQLVAQAALLHGGEESTAQAVVEFTAWSEELGVPAMHAAMGLLQYKEASAALHAAGALIALSPSLLESAARIDGSEEEAAGAYASDNAAALAAVGVDAALAQAVSGCHRLTVSNCDAPLLVWSVMLALVEGLANDARRRLAVALAACDPPVVPAVLDLIVLLLPSADAAGGGAGGAVGGAGAAAASPQQTWCIRGHVREQLCTSGLVAPWHSSDNPRLSAYDLSALSVGIFRSLLRQIPAALRSWFSMLKDAQLAAAVEEYTRRQESPPLLQQDIRAAAEVRSDSMAITASGSAREVVAAMEVDDGVMLELAIRLPPCYPLQPAEVSLRKKVAIQERSLRRWLLSIAGYLRSQNCSLADAVMLWKSNVDQEFAGVEPCMICYAVVNPSDRSLPRMPCKTCSQVFHSICLYKWFKSRSKSICPHCQCPW